MKPTDNELEMAIVAAETMCESGEDEHHVGKTLLHLYQRLQTLEKVCAAAQDYLDSGQQGPQHVQLEVAIETARQTGQ